MGGDSVWALLCSLAVTNSISIDFFSCPYADVSTQGVPNLYRSCQKDTGVPIRKSTDQRFHAPPRGLSQLGTSIIGSRAQPFTRRHSNAKRHYYTTNILLNCLYFFKDPDSFSLPALTNKPLKRIRHTLALHSNSASKDNHVHSLNPQPGQTGGVSSSPSTLLDGCTKHQIELMNITRYALSWSANTLQAHKPLKGFECSAVDLLGFEPRASALQRRRSSN
jgi:hypothetical protein